MKKNRFVLSIVILVISLAFLIWGFMPNPREIRVQPISPAEMQLPTPSSYHSVPEDVL